MITDAIQLEITLIDTGCHHRAIIHPDHPDQLIGLTKRFFQADCPARLFWRRTHCLHISAQINQRTADLLLAQECLHNIGDIAFGDGAQVDLHPRPGQHDTAACVIKNNVMRIRQRHARLKFCL